MKVIKVMGKEKVIGNLKLVSGKITSNAHQGLSQGARILRGAAINQLNSRAVLVGGSGIDSISLYDNWKVIQE